MAKPVAKPGDAMEWVLRMERQDADFKRRVEEELAAMDLEQQLYDLREARGLSQAQLARALGVTQQAIAKAESGGAKNVELRTLIRHVLALGGRLEVRVLEGPRKPPAKSQAVSRTMAAQRAKRAASG
jgi:DNA-binding XRE family transcriptional regulator